MERMEVQNVSLHRPESSVTTRGWLCLVGLAAIGAAMAGYGCGQLNRISGKVLFGVGLGLIGTLAIGACMSQAVGAQRSAAVPATISLELRAQREQAADELVREPLIRATGFIAWVTHPMTAHWGGTYNILDEGRADFKFRSRELVEQLRKSVADLVQCRRDWIRDGDRRMRAEQLVRTIDQQLAECEECLNPSEVVRCKERREPAKQQAAADYYARLVA
jgi:hypothetical protein